MKQSEKDLYRHLQEQIRFLINSCSEYDRGQLHEAKRISVIIRTLVHDTGISTSLLKSLKKKSILFVDTATEVHPNRVGSHNGLISMRFRGGIMDYAPRLNRYIHYKKTEFERWWDKVLFIGSNQKTISRKYLVLNLSDTDGGAHIDPKLRKKYADLSRRNVLGWVNVKDGVKSKPQTDPVLPSIRQIGYELILTLEDEFPNLFGLENLKLKISKHTEDFIHTCESNLSKPVIYRDMKWHYSSKFRDLGVTMESESNKNIVWIDREVDSLDYHLASNIIVFSLHEDNYPQTARSKDEESNHELQYIGAFIESLVYDSIERPILYDNGFVNKHPQNKITFNYEKLKQFKDDGKLDNYSLDFCDVCLNYLSLMRLPAISVVSKVLFWWRVRRIDKNIVSVGNSLLRIIRETDEGSPELVFSKLARLRDSLHLQGRIFIINKKGLRS